MHASPEKRNAYLRGRYAANRRALAQKQKEWREKQRLAAVEKLGGQCVRCGRAENLHFDHLDPRTKVDAIENLINAPQEKLPEELEKCQLLCEDCHRLKTRENGDHGQGETRHGTARMYNRYRCRCDACRVWKRNYDIAWKAKRDVKSDINTESPVNLPAQTPLPLSLPPTGTLQEA